MACVLSYRALGPATAAGILEGARGIQNEGNGKTTTNEVQNGWSGKTTIYFEWLAGALAFGC
jgi:hypothetical protein